MARGAGNADRGPIPLRLARCPLYFGYLLEAALMPAAVETGREPQRDDLLSQAEADDASAEGEDVGVVVAARQPRRIQIVAEGGADAVHFVRGDLFSLTAAADD